jgi:hypothetical protein
MTETGPLVRVRLVPVEVFGADEDNCRSCGEMVPSGYGLMDAVAAWSDCNRAIGRIYRKDDEYSDGYREPGDVITVYVPESEMGKFDRRYGETVEGGYDRCPACKIPYTRLSSRHRLKHPECETALPHEPVWNLLPFGGRRDKPPWKCDWHGWVEDERCGECKREHAEYRETGNWTPKAERSHLMPRPLRPPPAF